MTNEPIPGRFDGSFQPDAQDMGGALTTPRNEFAVAGSVAEAYATIQARMTVAKKFPRSIEGFRRRMLEEAKRPGFAEICEYSKPVGKEYDNDLGEWVEKRVNGPSVHFARAALRNFQNIAAGARNLHEDDERSLIRVECQDYESNGYVYFDVTVRREVERKKLKKGQQALKTRSNSYGDQVYMVRPSDDEFRTAEARIVAIYWRNAVLNFIPGDVVDEVLKAARKTTKEDYAKSPEAWRRRMIDRCAAINIGPDDLAKWLGHPVETITNSEALELRDRITGVETGDLNWQQELMDRVAAREDALARRTRPTDKPDVATPDANSAPAPASAAPAPAATTAATTAAPAPENVTKKPETREELKAAVRNRRTVATKTEPAQAPAPAPATTAPVAKPTQAATPPPAAADPTAYRDALTSIANLRRAGGEKQELVEGMLRKATSDNGVQRVTELSLAILQGIVSEVNKLTTGGVQ